MYKQVQTRRFALMLLAGTMALLFTTGLSLLIARSQAQAQPVMKVTAWTRTKTVNKTTAAPGDILTYTITIQNPGATVDVWVTDTLPVELTCITDSLQTTWLGEEKVIATDNTITWNAQDFGNGNFIIITFSAQISPEIPYAVFSNTAQITGTGSLEEFSSLDTIVTTDVGDLDNDGTSKTVSPQGKVNPGSMVTYTIRLNNSKSYPVPGVQVVDALPPGLALVGGSITYDEGNHSVNNGVITWTVDMGGLDDTDLVFQAVVLDYPGLIINIAELSAPEHKAFTRESPSVATVIGNLDNELTYKTVSPEEQIEPGDVLTYMVRLSTDIDNGDPVPRVQVVDELPPGLRLVDGSVTVEEGDYVTGSNVITWTLDMGKDRAGVDLKFQALVLPNDGRITRITNTAKLTASGHDPLTLTKIITAYQRHPELEAIKSVSPWQGYPGDLVTYVVRITNTGDGEATTVWMTDTLPSGLIYQTGTLDASVGSFGEANGVITWNATLGPSGTVWLPAQEQATITYTAQISPDITSNTEIINTAQVTGTGKLVSAPAYVQATVTSYLYLPRIVRRWPPIPYTPTLIDINNSDNEPDYTVVWTYSGSTNVSYYLLQEATNDDFTANVVQYTVSSSPHDITGKDGGAYYYRVRAHNTYGPGEWSETKSTTVIVFDYSDDFSDHNSGWPRMWDRTRGALYEVRPYEHPQCPGDDCAYDGDGYTIARRAGSPPYARFGPGVTIPSENYEIEVDARWLDAQYRATYKIFFGSNKDFTEFYSLDVLIDDPSVPPPSNCLYRLLREDSNGEHVIKDWRPSSAIDCHVRSQEPTPWNHWKIERKGNMIHIYVNNELLTSQYDSTFGANRYFGVGATCYEGLTPSKPEFDNWNVEIIPETSR